MGIFNLSPCDLVLGMSRNVQSQHFLDGNISVLSAQLFMIDATSVCA